MHRQNKKNAVVLERMKEGRTMLELIKKRKRKWLGHCLRGNCLLKDAIEQRFSNFFFKWGPFFKSEWFHGLLFSSRANIPIL